MSVKLRPFSSKMNPVFSALSWSVKRIFCGELEVKENKNMNMRRIPQKIVAFLCFICVLCCRVIIDRVSGGLASAMLHSI